MPDSTIAARIKIARKMAGLNTQALLLKKVESWKPSRLGNYEAGISTPGADDILIIAEATGVSPCWLIFGIGPIRSEARDLQAIRHQNLGNWVHQLVEKRGAVSRLAKALGMIKKELDALLENPFQPVSDQQARQFELHLNLRSGWMDEQHVEHDPLCMSFPDDIRELMMLYSQQPPQQRQVILETVRTLARYL